MSRPRTRICVLVSGGIDSAVLLARLLAQGRRVIPVYIRCGLRWEAAELHYVRKLLHARRAARLAPLVVLDLPLTGVYRAAGPDWSVGRGTPPSARSADRAVYLPGRNLWLLMAAAIYCAKQGIHEIALGTLRGNPFGDATPDFFQSCGRTLTRALGAPIRVRAPLRRLSKAQVAHLAGPAEIRYAFSCLQPRGMRPCGRCNKCAEQRRALRTIVRSPSS